MEKVDSFVVFVTYRTATPELINFRIATFDWFINLFPMWQVPLRSINASFILFEHLIWWLIGFDQLTEKLLRKWACVRKWVIWIKKGKFLESYQRNLQGTSSLWFIWSETDTFCSRRQTAILCGRGISSAWVFLNTLHSCVIICTGRDDQGWTCSLGFIKRKCPKYDEREKPNRAIVLLS